MYSHFTFLSVCHLMTCYDDRFGSSHKRGDCRHLLLFHGIQLLTAVSSINLQSLVYCDIPYIEHLGNADYQYHFQNNLIVLTCPDYIICLSEYARDFIRVS